MWVRPFRAGDRTAALTLVLVLAGVVVAQRGMAGADDRTVAQTVMKDLEGDPARQTAAAPFVARARVALERGARMRAAGDETRARLADALARDWADAARDAAEAAVVETRAAAARRGAMDAGAAAEKEQALLEEGVARVGRLEAQLVDGGARRGAGK